MNARILIVLAYIHIFLQSQGVAQNSVSWKLPVVVQPSFKSDTFSIKNYGAVNDGLSLNTNAINAAIRECNAKGGGVVLIPAGMWLTGPVVLKSNVNLHLERNAMLLFTDDKSQYSLIESSWEGVPAVRNQSPVSGTDLINIAITGNGIIDGNGGAWRAVKKSKLTSAQWKELVASGGVLSDDEKTWYPSEHYKSASKLDQPGVLTNGKTLNDFAAYKDYFRPNLMVLTNCKNVLLDGPTFQNSAAWGLHPLMCENLTVRNVQVKNPWYAQNGDGIDVESCANVLIENSVFDVGDDGICIKSGKDEEGRKRGKPTRNVWVRNCTVYHAHGGFVIGSEMSGGASDLYVENCSFIGTDIGLRFKTKRGRGGIVENIYVRNISMQDIIGDAIFFDMYYDAKDPILPPEESREAIKTEGFAVTEATPQFRNFYIENIRCNGAERAIFIRGLPEMNIRDIYFSNLILKAHKGIEIAEAKSISLTNVQVVLQQTNPVITIANSSRITMDGIKYDKDSEVLFNMIGMKSASVKVKNTDVSHAKNKVRFSDGATTKSLEFDQ